MEIPHVFERVAIASTAASTELLKAAAAGKINRLHGLVCGSTGAATVTVQSSTSVISGPIPLAAATPLVIPFDARKESALATAANKNLSLAVSGIVGGYAVVSQSTD